MTGLLEGVDEIVAKLKTLTFDYQGEEKALAGRIVTDLAKVNPPCIWVAVESIDHTIGGGELLLRLFLIAPGSLDEYRAIGALSPLLDVVLGVVSPTEETTVQAVAPTFQQKALPALRVTTSLSI